MKIIIVGAGLIGVTTAYFLSERGHDVMVVDRGEGAGRETSFANGALLHPSMPEPWNAPGCWRVLLASVGRSDSPMQLRMRAVPSLARWGVRFLRNSTAAKFERSSLRNLHLALYSLEVMALLRERTGIEYGRHAVGTLRVFRDTAALDRTALCAERRLKEGLRFRRLSVAETVELEPGLAPIADQLSGAIHYEGDEIGNAYRFCVSLAAYAQQLGVTFRFRTEVSSLELRSGRVSAVLCEGERLVADQYIVAAGSHSVGLLRLAGVHAPVQPAKGYSITFETEGESRLLSIPVIDDQLHAAVVPLEGAIRVVGTAEFAGYDLTINPGRVQNLLGLLRRVLPQAKLDSTSGRPWCGLRPMSVDGLPIIGASPVSNLFINTGHGHLGWTMAAGSAALLVDMMCGGSPSIDPSPFALARFTSAH